MKVVSHKSVGESEDTGLKVVPCLTCGRIWIQTRDKGTEECPHCGDELYPVRKRIEAGKELRLPDGMDLRIGQDKFLREVAIVVRGLINQTICDCTKGVRCYHCQAIAILRDFPGPEEGSLEDDWATVRGKPPERTDPVREIPDEERGWYQRLLDEDDAGGLGAPPDLDEPGPDDDDPNAPTTPEIWDEDWETLFRDLCRGNGR